MKNSMAIAYNMKRKKMAEGGNVLSDTTRSDNEKGINKPALPSGKIGDKGRSEAGASLHPAFSMGDEFDKDVAKRKHKKTLGEMKSMKKPNLYADGGEVEGSPEMDVMQPKDDVPWGNQKDLFDEDKGASESGMKFSSMANVKNGLKEYFGMANGGFITDNYQPNYLERSHPDLRDHEKESGYMDHEGNMRRPNMAAMSEEEKRLNQHMVHPEDSMKYGMVDKEMHQDSMDYSGLDRFAMGGDVVDKVMRKKYSMGGRVANGGDDDLSKMADGRPNNFDDLALRDDLESSSNGSNNGDFLGDDQEDMDREDILARIMRQRKMKKNHNPVPA